MITGKSTLKSSAALRRRSVACLSSYELDLSAMMMRAALKTPMATMTGANTPQPSPPPAPVARPTRSNGARWSAGTARDIRRATGRVRRGNRTAAPAQWGRGGAGALGAGGAGLVHVVQTGQRNGRRVRRAVARAAAPMWCSAAASPAQPPAQRRGSFRHRTAVEGARLCVRLCSDPAGVFVCLHSRPCHVHGPGRWHRHPGDWRCRRRPLRGRAAGYPERP